MYSLSLREITKEELRKYVKQLKGNRSSGIDQIDSFCLKLAAPYIEDVLLHLINLSVRNSSFNGNWKTQLIHPYHKKGDKCDGSN